MFDKIPKLSRPKLKPYQYEILIADGTPMNVAGRCTMDLAVGHIEVEHDCIIADIEAEGLLGSDFLVKHNCVLNFKSGVLEVEGESVPYRDHVGSLIICRVKVVETVTIPAGEEAIIAGKLIKRGKHNLCGVIEPSEQFVSKTGILVGKSLVDPNNRTVPVRVMNLSEEPKTIHQDSVVGTYQPVVGINQSQSEEMLKVTEASSENKQETCVLPEHLLGLFERSSKFLDENQKVKLSSFLSEFKDVFAVGDHDLGRTGLVKHKINVGDNAPIKQAPRRLPLHQRLEEEKQIEQMLSRDVIEVSDSPWGSPIVLVKKKDGSYRYCIDYRRLNKISVKDAYPLPRPDDCFDALYGSVWFSTLDLCSGYWQVELDIEDRPKSAFITRSGLFQFKVLPFGLCNATATFERLMELVMAGLQWKICLIYLDDIIVYGKTFEQELERLKEVFLRLRKANLKLKVKKCELFQQSVSFLGHIVSKDGISADPEKVQAVKSWPSPNSVTEVRSFLGFCSYYRKFVKGFADIASPLHKITEKGRKFEWTDECQDAFESLKDILTSTPILAYPDESSSFILDTDASEIGIGAVLSQIQDGNERVLAYASRKLNKAERSYCVTRRELLAVVHFVKHFKHYLYGRKFLIRTDHGSLRWLMNFKSPEGQIARWLEVLGTFSFEIQHRPGRQHGNADGLSRVPCRQCGRSDQDDALDSESVTGVTAESDREEIVPPISEQLVDSSLDREETTQVKQRVTGVSSSGGEVVESVEVVGISSSGGEQTKVAGNDIRISELESIVKEKDVMEVSISSVVQRVRKEVRVDDVKTTWLEGWSVDELRNQQLLDPDIAGVLLWKEQGMSRPLWKDISRENKYVKTLWSQWDRLHVWQGVLYRRWESADGLHIRYQLVLPKQMIPEVLKHLHNSPSAGHLGVSRTLANVKLRFYWPMHQTDVKTWVKQCDLCASRKPTPNQRKATLKQHQAGEPLERVAIDILGPLPTSNDGNKYIMIVVDYFTKWAEAYAIPNQEASTVAAKLVYEFIAKLGCPRQIHTDQGRNFESKLFKQICQLLDIDKTRTTPFHPQSDGLVERFNRTLENMLSLYVADNQKDWDQYLQLMMMAYRATPQGSSQCSPNLLMLGREVELPIDLMIGRPPGDENSDHDESDYVIKLRQKLESAHEYARYHLQKSANRQKRNYDHRVQSDRLSVGDFVWLYSPAKRKGISPKLQCKWTGPFLIIDVLDDCVYRIQKSPKCKPKVVHRDRITKYNGKDAHNWLKDLLILGRVKVVKALYLYLTYLLLKILMRLSQWARGMKLLS